MFVYLDNNATTGVAKEVLETMLPFLQEEYGNPSSMYEFARKPIKERNHDISRESETNP